MKFETIDGLFTIQADMIISVALAAILLIVGYYIKDRSKFLTKYCIPAPVIGGFLFMLITWAGHVTGSFTVAFDTVLQDFFMLAFFTTVGLGASVELLKQGGKLLIVYWLIAGFVSVIENTIGIVVSKVTGLEPAYALLSSAITMIGGHGAGLSYGTTFAEMGYAQGPLVGAAAATFGLISSVLVGGPTARRLIEKHNLRPREDQSDVVDVSGINATDTSILLTNMDATKNVTVILICMAFGSIIAGWIGSLIGMSFPTYVGAMFVAVIARNLNDSHRFYNFNFRLVDGIGDVALGLYLSMAMMALKMWELADLAGPMLVVLICQVAFLVLFAYFVVFRILGKDYDAAVMCAGLLGHGLGATPTAIVNLTAVNDKYGMSRKAMMIVPIVGAFLVDILYQPQTIWFIKTFVGAVN
ncbi:sodium/glutamate symporter [Peptoniphilus equinus]|uniref:Sodium/glutamate symporter n=1 Tax=Peptoniphilus equinus TaxID=3016343 RepID=A0ABY7QTS3_9FIRM|nr:sodium/glutamate symporter [Peptoniphilus equinus]WBW50194.1 sodium/glutamate symporter [Peptoniphilus equinus]